MGVLVVLVANQDPAAQIGPEVAQQLAALGVTNLSVLRDEHTTAVALEGWGFDPTRSGEAAARTLAAERNSVRVLRPVIESAVHPLRTGAAGASERKAEPK